MKVQLLLALIVLMQPLRGVFGALDFDVTKEAAKKGRGFGDFKTSSPSDLKGLGQVEAKVKDIIVHTGKLVDIMTGNSRRQDFFLDLCEKVAESQKVVQNSLRKVIETSTAAESNTAQIKSNQDAMLKNQEGILNLVLGQHKITRKNIAQAETTLVNGMQKLIQTQGDIDSSLQKSGDFLAAGFNRIVEAERQTQVLNSQVLKAVEESAAANALGQANITAELKDIRQETVEALNKALDQQENTLNQISTAEKSQLSKLDQVQSNLLDILKLVGQSQKAVQQSIHEANAIERETQSLVKVSQKVIQKELGEHKKDQKETQHLAKKCLENTKCDLDKVNDALVQLVKLNTASRDSIREGLKEIRSKQSATQGRVKSTEKTVIKAIGAGFNAINRNAAALVERLESSRSQSQNQFKVIEKNIRDTRHSQENARGLIHEIHSIINKLLKH
uniref:Capsule protein 1b n=1 Tax=Busycotypus canaliculatus TaxID=57622 RepID=D2KCI2_BUSCA|nr:capsule protein 1b [Busycotypus canaliculatus]